MKAANCTAKVVLKETPLYIKVNVSVKATRPEKNKKWYILIVEILAEENCVKRYNEIIVIKYIDILKNLNRFSVFAPVLFILTPIYITKVG